MMKFIKTIILTMLSLCTIFSMGQDSSKTKKNKEYYIGPSDISPLDISIKYKLQLKNKTFFKIGLIDLSARSNSVRPDVSTSFPTSTYNYSAGIEFGIEFRKLKTDKFTFYHGPNINFTYNMAISNTDNPALPKDQRESTNQTFNGGIPYTLGLLFQLNRHFFLSTEINPGIFITRTDRDNGTNSLVNFSTTSTNFSFSNNNAFLSIAYRL